MSARDDLLADIGDAALHGRFNTASMTASLDAYRAEVLAEAADLAHAEGNRLYDGSGQRHAAGAWAVRDALRARADHDPAHATEELRP